MSTKILVVDDKQMMRDSVGATLQRAGYTVVVAANGKLALKMVEKHRPRVVVTDLMMPEMDGHELLDTLLQSHPQLPVVLMTAYGSINDAVAAMKAGAFDFVQKPFEGDQLVTVVRRAAEQQRLMNKQPAATATTAATNAKATAADKAASRSPQLVGDSPAMQAVARQIQQIAELQRHRPDPRRIGHRQGSRLPQPSTPRRPAATRSCSASTVPPSPAASSSPSCSATRKARSPARISSARAASSSPTAGRCCSTRSARSPRSCRPSCCVCCRKGQFERVGSSTTMQVDVRVIATTNRDLTRSVAEGTLPPGPVLPAERVADPAAAAAGARPRHFAAGQHFLEQVGEREGREAKTFDADAEALLEAYHWPGNVRELQNICERASVLAPGPVVDAALLRPWLAAACRPRARHRHSRRPVPCRCPPLQ